MQGPIRLSVDEWEDVYSPHVVWETEDSSYWDWVEDWNNQEEWARLMSAHKERRLLTGIDGDNGQIALISGLHYVNRCGYILTDVAYPEESIIEVYDYQRCVMCGGFECQDHLLSNATPTGD